MTYSYQEVGLSNYMYTLFKQMRKCLSHYKNLAGKKGYYFEGLKGTSFNYAKFTYG